MQAAAGIPLLLLLLLRRGRGDDPVPRGGPCADRAGLLRAPGLFLLATLLLALGAAFAGDVRGRLGTLLLLDGGAKIAALVLGVLLFTAPGAGPPPAPAPGRRAIPAGVLAGLAFLPVATAVLLLQQWGLRAAGWEMEEQALVREAVTGPLPSFLLVAGFALVVAPLFEETLFRTHLYAGLRSFLGPAASALLTAALFAAFHGEPVAWPVTFLLGLCLAYLRERTGGRSAPIAMHACYNAGQVGGMLLLRLTGSTGGV